MNVICAFKWLYFKINIALTILKTSKHFEYIYTRKECGCDSSAFYCNAFLLCLVLDDLLFFFPLLLSPFNS